ncbi:hypothetical protein CEB3_c04020 [Peptococcaceae bacterium CEB3]|nr:hypothetical protein CEB3_c04020 [Peptococcaceae bacterium CEB3]
MRILALFLALLFWLALSLAIKAQIDFRYRRKDERDHLEIGLRALHGLWQFNLQVPTIQFSWEKGPLIEMDPSVRSGQTRSKMKTQARFRYVRHHFLLRLWPRLHRIMAGFRRARARFYRSVHCTALEWRVAIGCRDPVHTALAAGAFWSVLGVALTRFYRQIQVRVKKPLLQVTPLFQTPGFSCDIHCIFQLRIGHIIFAGISLLRTIRLGKRG